jgi:uncharacterized protein YggE
MEKMNGVNRRTVMKFRYTIGALLAVASLAVLVACGGDDDGGGSGVSGIRTHKGLAVAAVAEGLAATGAEESDTTSIGAPVPAADRQTAGGAGSAIGYDTATSQDSTRFGGASLLQQGADGVTVQGYGSATADADSAIIELYFSRNGPVTDVPSSRAEPGSSGSGAEPAAPGIAPDAQEVAPITEADLQPVIDAIAAAGVPRDKIQFVGQPYFDKFYSSATLRATVDNVDAVDAVVQAANNASAALSGITVNGTNVSYTVQDCAALEEAAMKAAVEDAGERAVVFSRALGVGVGAVKGASNYSYFGGTPCDPGFYAGPYPLGGITYAEGQPREVQVIANISVTYTIQ